MSDNEELRLTAERGRIDKSKEEALDLLTSDVARLVSQSTMSQREISKRLSTSETQVSRLLKVSFKSKTFDQLVRVASALGYRTKFTFEKLQSQDQATQSKEQRFLLLSGRDFKNQKTNFEGFN